MSEPDPTNIRHEEDAEGGAFLLEHEGRRIGELTYVTQPDGGVVIDHTGVRPEFGGRGLARALLDAAVAWARATGTKVRATCPYARAQFDKDPGLRDVLADPEP